MWGFFSCIIGESRICYWCIDMYRGLDMNNSFGKYFFLLVYAVLVINLNETLQFNTSVPTEHALFLLLICCDNFGYSDIVYQVSLSVNTSGVYCTGKQVTCAVGSFTLSLKLFVYTEILNFQNYQIYLSKVVNS